MHIRATYEVEDAVVAFDSAKTHARFPANVLVAATLEKENAEASLAAAQHKVDVTYKTRSTTTTPSNCMGDALGIPAASSSSTMPAKP